MEIALKSLNLITDQDMSNPRVIQLEFQFLDIIATDNIVHSALHLLPVVDQGKVFLRFIEKGICRGFTAKFTSVIASKFNVDTNQIFPWIV